LAANRIYYAGMAPPLFLGWLITYRYAIIFPLTILQGPTVMLICGFLIRLGGFDFWPTYFLLMIGDFTGDVLWYLVGRHGARALVSRFGQFLSISMDDVDRLERLFAAHPTKILFISKITMGFGLALATLVAAGAARVPFRKYALINIAGGFIWTGILIAVGFFFGNLYLTIDKSLRIIATIAAVLFLLAALAGFSRYLRKRFRKTLDS
jgi:membrane protein DedA with SNARE-associated domain